MFEAAIVGAAIGLILGLYFVGCWFGIKWLVNEVTYCYHKKAISKLEREINCLKTR